MSQRLTSGFKVGSLAAFAAALSLVIANGAFVGAGQSAEGVEQTLTQINNNTVIFIVAFVAVAAISLFDIFTVPGLYFAVSESQPTLALWGAILALVGDIVGLASGVIQTSLLQLSAGYLEASGAERTVILAASETVDRLEAVLGTTGFLLVGPSFIFFGLGMLKGGFSRWLGWVGIVAGILSIIGLVPSLLILFLVANILYLVWYIGIGARFRKLAVQDQQKV